MPLASWLLVVTILALPALSVTGAWLGARRLGKRTDVPRFVTWTAFALVLSGAAFVALALFAGLVVGLGALSAETVEPSQKARALAEGISEAMNCGAVGFVFAVVAALWLGFCAWRWRSEPRPRHATRRNLKLGILDALPSVLGAAVGIAASLWPQAVLRGHIPRRLPPYPVSWGATAFWLLLVGNVVTTFIFVRRLRREAQGSEDSRRVHDLVAGLTQTATWDFYELRAQPEAALRRMLWYFTVLAWTLDDKPSGVRYAANVMRFVPWEDADEDQKGRRRFSDHDEEEMFGLLMLEPSWSTVRESKAAIDTELAQFALSVPRDLKRNGRLRVLPGAPRAFLERNSDFYMNANEMLTYCRKETSLGDKVIDELKTYLSSSGGSRVRSFLSIAILPPDGNDPVGVLNVHADRPGIVQDSAETFVEASEVLVGLLASALALATRARKSGLRDQG